MPNYCQLASNNLVHTVMETNGQLEGANIIEVPDCDPKYLGCFWDGSVFCKLSIFVNKSSLSLNEVTNVTIQWIDPDGNPVICNESVELKCQGNSEVVNITNGTGATTFQSAEAGEFILEANSSITGVRTFIKVVVS